MPGAGFALVAGHAMSSWTPPHRMHADVQRCMLSGRLGTPRPSVPGIDSGICSLARLLLNSFIILKHPPVQQA